MAFLESLFGKSGGQVPTLTPEQQKAQGNLLQNLPQLLQLLSGPIQPSAGFENIANREMNKFQTQTVPSLAERFTAMGAPLSSGGYSEALRRGTTDLHTNLAALGYQAGANERSQQLDLLRTILSGGMSPATAYMARQPGLFENVLTSAIPAAGAYFGGGGTLGALAGLFGGGKSQQHQPYDLSSGYQTLSDVNQMLMPRMQSPQDFFKASGIARG